MLLRAVLLRPGSRRRCSVAEQGSLLGSLGARLLGRLGLRAGLLQRWLLLCLLRQHGRDGQQKVLLMLLQELQLCLLLLKEVLLRLILLLLLRPLRLLLRPLRLLLRPLRLLLPLGWRPLCSSCRRHLLHAPLPRGCCRGAPKVRRLLQRPLRAAGQETGGRQQQWQRSQFEVSRRRCQLSSPAGAGRRCSHGESRDRRPHDVDCWQVRARGWRRPRRRGSYRRKLQVRLRGSSRLWR